MRNKSGFTLIELMVTIALIAIIMAGVVPAMMEWRNNAQLSRGARQIYSDLQDARKTAIKFNRLTSVTFDEGDGTYTVSKPDPANPANLVATVRNLPPQVIIQSAEFETEDDNNALFNNMGFGRDNTNADNSGEVTIVQTSGRQRTSTIRVETSGNIRIQ